MLFICGPFTCGRARAGLADFRRLINWRRNVVDRIRIIVVVFLLIALKVGAHETCKLAIYGLVAIVVQGKNAKFLQHKTRSETMVEKSRSALLPLWKCYWWSTLLACARIATPGLHWQRSVLREGKVKISGLHWTRRPDKSYECCHWLTWLALV